MENKTKKMLVLLGVIVVIVLIIVVAASQGKKKASLFGEQSSTSELPGTATTTPEEVAPSKSATPITAATPEAIKDAKSIAVGTSLVTASNVVVTSAGDPVKLNVMPANPDAPRESAPISSAAAIKNDANSVKISVSAAGFVPNSFTVKEGQLVNFVLTSTDSFTHVWLPDDMSLIATVLGVAGGETRVKSWNAPKKGTYTFRCDIPGHKERGEVGKMIVE